MMRDLKGCEAKPKLSERIGCMMEVYVNNVIVGVPLGMVVGKAFGTGGGLMLLGLSATHTSATFGGAMGMCAIIDPSNLDDL